MKVIVQRLAHAKDLPLPAYATEGAAGLDLLAAVDTDMELAPRERAAVPCGIALAIPAGYEAQVRPRSGLAINHGVTVLNSPGTIDSDYRGEVKAILINHSDTIFRIARGMKIAQMVFAKFEQAQLSEGELDTTARGDKGFGSTGLRRTGTA